MIVNPHITLKVIVLMMHMRDCYSTHNFERGCFESGIVMPHIALRVMLLLFFLMT